MAKWSTIQTIPAGIFRNFGFTSIGQYAYLIGGKIQTAPNIWAPNPNVYLYDSASNKWSLKTTIPSGYGKISTAISAKGYIYCFSLSDYAATQTVIPYLYDPTYNTWQTLKSIELSAGAAQRFDYPAFITYSNNFILAFPVLSFIERDDDKLIIYDILNNNWIKHTSLPTKRTSVNTATIGDKSYVMGGALESSNLNRPVDIVDSFNSIDFTWNTAAPMLTAKSYFVTAKYKNEIYAVAGNAYGYIENPTTWLSDVQIYNAESNSWRFGINSPFSGSSYDVYLAEYSWSATCDDIIIFTNGANYYILDMQEASITNPSPAAGFINEKVANTFSWTLETNPAGTLQKSADFQWRGRDSTSINTINIGAAQSITIPANTLPNGEFEWRVTATSANDIIAPFTEWFLLTTIDAKPNQPTGLYPNSGSRDGTEVIQFSWIHNAPLSTPQVAFELQITYDGGITWRDLSDKVMTANTQFIAAANTILPTDPTGRVGWRVRTYNTDDVASDWSSTAYFIVHPAPQAPNWISVETGRARPLCRWTSLGQVGYQIQVLSGETILFDSGEVHGTAVEYRIPEFLQNGIFTFRLRIKNIRGLLSEWANRTVSINAHHSLDIALQGEAVKNGARLTFDVEVRLIE